MSSQAAPIVAIHDEVRELRRAVERWRSADAEWVSALLDLAAKLLEARNRYPSNQAFGDWLDAAKINLKKNDRAALLNIAEHGITADAILATDSRSPQYIWNRLPCSLTKENDPYEQWKGMPEFVQEDQGPVQTLYVHFAAQEDVEKFAALVGQPISGKTRSIWFPRAEIVSYADKRYVDADSQPSG